MFVEFKTNFKFGVKKKKCVYYSVKATSLHKWTKFQWGLPKLALFS